MELTRIRFKRFWQAFAPGDVAGFGPKVAKMLVDQKFGDLADVKEPAVKPVVEVVKEVVKHTAVVDAEPVVAPEKKSRWNKK